MRKAAAAAKPRAAATAAISVTAVHTVCTGQQKYFHNSCPMQTPVLYMSGSDAVHQMIGLPDIT